MAHPKKSVITPKDWLLLSVLLLWVILLTVFALNRYAQGAMSL